MIIFLDFLYSITFFCIVSTGLWEFIADDRASPKSRFFEGSLHISQSTISRDIHYIQKEIHKSKENYGKRLFKVYRNSLLGLDEVIKKLWTIIDSSKTGDKEKMKAINLIMQCYRMRFEMIKSEPVLINQKRYMKDLNYRYITKISYLILKPHIFLSFLQQQVFQHQKICVIKSK